VGGTGLRVQGSGIRIGSRVHAPWAGPVTGDRVAELGSGGVHGSGFTVQGSGLRVQGSGFEVHGSRFTVRDSGLRTWSLSETWCLELVWSLGFEIWSFSGAQGSGFETGSCVDTPEPGPLTSHQVTGVGVKGRVQG
jgi:hypothetical protein